MEKLKDCSGPEIAWQQTAAAGRETGFAAAQHSGCLHRLRNQTPFRNILMFGDFTPANAYEYLFISVNKVSFLILVKSSSGDYHAFVLFIEN